MMHTAGHNVHSISSADEVLSHLETKEAHLLIIDKDLAPEGGISILEKLRQLELKLKTKIVFLIKEELDSDEKSRVRLLNVLSLKKDLTNHLMLKMILELIVEINEKTEKSRHAHLGKVLVVDDTPEIRVSLKTFLKIRGLDVYDAADGEQALRQVETEKPRLVITDERMPGMNGLTVLKKIKEIDSSIKVVMISGAQDEKVVRMALELGACDYITKPFSFQSLEALVLSILLLDKCRN